MPRKSNTNLRRKEIVEGLMKVMAEVGYDGATIPLIADAAKLAPGVIHYHFDSKQNILRELMEHLTANVQERTAQLSQGKKPKDELATFIEAHVGLGKGADSRAVACWIAIGAEAVKQPEIRAVYRKITKSQITTLEEICFRLLTEDGRSTKNKRQIALGIISAIEGAYRLLVSAPELIVPGFAAPTITAMAMGLLTTQPKLKKK